MDEMESGQQVDYVQGANTGKYMACGAPGEWNSLYVASALEKHIKSIEPDFLEWAHIEIFAACLHQPFEINELDSWVEDIYKSIKGYFFISLADGSQSTAAIGILKKFFCNEQKQVEVLNASMLDLITTLQKIYMPDVDPVCKDNIKDFLEFLHDSEEYSSPNLKEFVYTAIKNFAENKGEQVGAY
jgi:hypothetical protein